jgi:hypothetical protein
VQKLRLDLARVRSDLKAPLPGAEGWSRRRRLAFRVRRLLRTYGWKLVFIFFLYYLVRDLVLYVVLPLLVADAVVG